MNDSIDTQTIYDSLKDFQQDTVDFAYERLKNNGRYLVADEVGLGKTMIAKGIIAKTYDDLKNQKDSIEIIYITTNQSIASQNIETLKIGNSKTKTKRLSLLVTTLNEKNAEISFRSFTVGTSLEFKGSSTGLKEEREFLIYLLKETGLVKRLHNTTLDTFFKQTANEVDTYREFTIPKDFSDIFKDLVNNNFTDLKKQISSNHDDSSTIIKELRKLLVIANLKYLSPDLIILDEFQRFSKLLVDDNYEDKEIIDILFNNDDNQSKTLLLSATPYKLLDCKNNEHYDEFYSLIRWLDNNSNYEITDKLEKLFNELHINRDNKEEIESILKNIMCRTERYSFNEDNFEEFKIKNLKLQSTMKHYLNEYEKYSSLNIQGITRYLKSAPSALNYMKESGYIAKRNFLELYKNKNIKIKENQNHPKLQMLKQEVKNQALEKYIWMPPLSPYVESSDYEKSITKVLIFSQWDFVPDSIVGTFPETETKTNYTDINSFKDRDTLLRVTTKGVNPYAYEDILSFKDLKTKTEKEFKELYKISNPSTLDIKVLLGSPANVIYRSILKYTDIKNIEEEKDFKSIGELFLHYLGKKKNREIIGMDRNEGSEKRLIKILDYSIKHNIQSMMDEYIHLLTDSPRYKNIKDDKEKLSYLLETFKTILKLRPNEIVYHEYYDKKYYKITKTSKFAMRISKSSMVARPERDETPITADNVKTSFNSPFAPFVLATTSIGQEGLDFHPYCNQIWHWDLPSNPVDLEQREGRINRYKNYAVRKNIAKSFNDRCWIEKFNKAKKEKACDFKTFWLYSSKNAKEKIQRVIPLLPLSREFHKYEHLKKQLELYRGVMGQKKQDEKINSDENYIPISLKPPILPKEL